MLRRKLNRIYKLTKSEKVRIDSDLTLLHPILYSAVSVLFNDMANYRGFRPKLQKYFEFMLSIVLCYMKRGFSKMSL